MQIWDLDLIPLRNISFILPSDKPPYFRTRVDVSSKLVSTYATSYQVPCSMHGLCLRTIAPICTAPGAAVAMQCA